MADMCAQYGNGLARHFHVRQGLELVPVTDSFTCPILQSEMRYPVMTVDGQVYEEEAIRQWFQSSEELRSPFTNMVLPSADLFPMQFLKDAVQEYMRGRPEIVAAFEAQRELQNEQQQKIELRGQVLDMRSQLEQQDTRMHTLQAAAQRERQNAEQQKIELRSQVLDMRSQLEQQDTRMHALQADLQALQTRQAMLAELASDRECGNRMLTSKVELLTSKVESVEGCLQVAVSPRAVSMATKIQALFRGHRCRRGCRLASAKQLRPKRVQSQTYHSKNTPSKSGGKQYMQWNYNNAEWDLIVKSRKSKPSRTEIYRCVSGIRPEDL